MANLKHLSIMIRSLNPDDRFKLTGLYLFPYLGSTRGDTVPGYFVIPDGVGALVRLNKSHNDTYQSRFYGSDMGYNSYTSSQLGMPIYGVVHEVGENALRQMSLKVMHKASFMQVFMAVTHVTTTFILNLY